MFKADNKLSSQYMLSHYFNNINCFSTLLFCLYFSSIFFLIYLVSFLHFFNSLRMFKHLWRGSKIFTAEYRFFFLKYVYVLKCNFLWWKKEWMKHIKRRKRRVESFIAENYLRNRRNNIDNGQQVNFH